MFDLKDITKQVYDLKLALLVQIESLKLRLDDLKEIQRRKLEEVTEAQRQQSIQFREKAKNMVAIGRQVGEVLRPLTHLRVKQDQIVTKQD